MASFVATPDRPAMRRFSLVVLAALVAGCVVEFQRVDVDPVATAGLPTAPPASRPGERTPVASPLRVHLADGSVALFPRGGYVSAERIVGPDATRVTFPDRMSTPIDGVALADVIGAETYSTDVDIAPSVLASAGASAVATAAFIAVGIVLFGSCPTVYAATPADTPALEAELFSNSIAPLFEMRDRDVLRHASPGADGAVRLEIRNEALETHYTNHLALEAVDHGPGTRAVPADDGHALVLAREAAPRRAVDRTGRDVTAALAAPDGVAYATAPSVVAGVSERDLHDAVTLTFQRPTDSEASALSLRFRSSLLTTVLLYEHMLAGQGAAALDWLGRDLASIGTVAAFGDVYTRRLGLRVDAEDEGGVWREVARIAEAGPVAWAERAVIVPLPPGRGDVRLRLRFVADGWRLDHATLAAAEAVETRPVPLVSAVDDAGARLPDIERGLRRPDAHHAVQGPGRAYHATFAPPPARPGHVQTLFVSAQGYYTEWMRPEWLARPDPRPFVMSDSSLVAAVRTWQRVRPAYEAQFWSSRLPVR